MFFMGIRALNHLLTHQLSGGGHWDDELPMKDGDVQCSISWVGGS